MALCALKLYPAVSQTPSEDVDLDGRQEIKKNMASSAAFRGPRGCSVMEG